MAETSQSYRSLWNHTGVFDSYELTRSMVGPAIGQIVGNVLTDNFQPGAKILEIGAGGGALRRYTGEAGNGYDWLESDYNPEFLQLPREIDTTKLAIALPDLPIRPNSLDGIISLGVLDTLSNHDLVGTVKAAVTSLAPGGKLIHLLDMLPDFEAELKNTRANGLFPLIFTNDDEAETPGLHYLSLEDLENRINQLPVHESVIGVFTAIVNNPELNVLKVIHSGMLPYFGAIAAEYGLVERTEPSWFKMLGSRLVNLFENDGLIIKQNNIVRAIGLNRDDILPAKLIGSGTTHIVRNLGLIKFLKDSSCILPTGKVNISADMQVVIAEKP